MYDVIGANANPETSDSWFWQPLHSVNETEGL